MEILISILIICLIVLIPLVKKRLEQRQRDKRRRLEFEAPCSDCGHTYVAKLYFLNIQRCEGCTRKLEDQLRLDERQRIAREQAAKQAVEQEKRRQQQSGEEKVRNRMRAQEQQAQDRRREQEQATRTIEGLQQLSGEEFEVVVKTVFEGLGWQVALTPRSGDGGIDLLVQRDNAKGVVQCKNWRDPVGISEVQRLFGVLTGENIVDNSFNIAFLVTTSNFSAAAHHFAKEKAIPERVHFKLVNGHEFLRMQADSTNCQTTAENQESSTSIFQCQICGQRLRIPSGSHRNFRCKMCRARYEWISSLGRYRKT